MSMSSLLPEMIRLSKRKPTLAVPLLVNVNKSEPSVPYLGKQSFWGGKP